MRGLFFFSFSRHWMRMCAVNYSCAWSRWMYLSAFYLQRKRSARARGWRCAMRWNACVRSLDAVALVDAGLQEVQSSWGGADTAQSVWWGKQFKHLQKLCTSLVSIFPTGPWDAWFNLGIFTFHCDLFCPQKVLQVAARGLAWLFTVCFFFHLEFNWLLSTLKLLQNSKDFSQILLRQCH